MADSQRGYAQALVADSLDEFCANCGSWVSYLHFNFEVGWCNDCSPISDSCIRCGTPLKDRTRSTCETCRWEIWLEKWVDELEFLIVAKGYSVNLARVTILRMSRPICKACGRPIIGGREGALFHGRGHPACHAKYREFKRLQRSGVAADDALTRVLQ